MSKFNFFSRLLVLQLNLVEICPYGLPTLII